MFLASCGRGRFATLAETEIPRRPFPNGRLALVSILRVHPLSGRRLHATVEAWLKQRTYQSLMERL